MKTELLNSKSSLILRQYQNPASDFAFYRELAILAMAPGAGKTETAIDVMLRFLNLYPNAKVLVLAHSTNVLKKNFFDRLVGLGMKNISSDSFEINKQIHVCLPNSKHKITGHYDFLIVDEAHENYLAKRVQDIIKTTKPNKQLLLTGSPSIFIKKGWSDNILVLALNELPVEFFAKLSIELVSTKAYWKGKINSDLMLKKDYEMSESEINSALNKIIEALLERLRTKIPAEDFNKKNWKYLAHTSRLGYLFHKLEKTVFFCKSVDQSKKVFEILKLKGINCILSNHKNDKKGQHVQDFKDGIYDALVVVDRARLGFSDDKLFNIVDMSGTHNPDLIYQIISRVVRGTPDMNKFYLKLTTTEPGMKDYTHACTCAALMLTDHKYLSTFNGNNFDGIVVPVVKVKKAISKTASGIKSKKRPTLKFPEFTNDVVEMFKDIINTAENTASIYKLTTLGDVKSRLLFDYESWSIEKAIEFAKICKSRQEFIKAPNGAYNYVSRKDKLEYVYDQANLGNLIKPNGYWTKERCMEIGKKYIRPTDWQRAKGDGSAYISARKNNWIEECTKHMVGLRKPKGFWDIKENCRIESLKYGTKNEWLKTKGAKGSYHAAYKNGWIDEFFTESMHKSIK